MDWKHKVTSTEDALRRIRRGSRIFIGSGCAEPLTLSHGLIENAQLFADNIIVLSFLHSLAALCWAGFYG